ncbi:hypothetical protein QYE76_068817 [Lolium multiflorum]|uniref:DUF4216 domain-containing protein n=1 Tax=Lolium multiflorum TaxID=4521 RepID=A0AAD8SH07_LOLMU|nr:hypothetical protein QYE76_068817 [Lolium multiflorum]
MPGPRHRAARSAGLVLCWSSRPAPNPNHAPPSPRALPSPRAAASRLPAAVCPPPPPACPPPTRRLASRRPPPCRAAPPRARRPASTAPPPPTRASSPHPRRPASPQQPPPPPAAASPDPPPPVGPCSSLPICAPPASPMISSMPMSRPPTGGAANRRRREPEEPEPTAKAFYDMIAAAKRPLYEGAAISQLDAISQCLADKTRYNTTREGFEASLKTTATPTGHQFEGYGVTHNWTHEAALTKLEYYKDLELPHNIDVMHTVKNVAESVFHTCLNIPGKSKDNVKARVDIEILCDREKLHMKRPIGRQKNWFKPHANFCLDSIQKKEAFRWLKYVVMFPDGYCSNMSCSREVTKYEKYDVNGFRFHTETNRANPKTINTGVFTKGANNFDYYGRLQSVYELTFNRTNVQLNIVVFKCHWFDPIGGQRSDKSIGLVEVKPSTTYSGADVFIVAHQAKQVYYLPYPCQKAELKGWEVVFQVSPHGNLPIPSEDDYNNIDPVTYEGIFYQEEQDFGEYILEPFVQEDLGNDAETRGESVVDLKDISMLEKLLEANDNYDEPPPVDPSTLYSQDSDSDSDPEKEKETEYESERESDDGW